MSGAEARRMEHVGRLEDGLIDASPWYLWGPYLAERAWGSVREDYSADGDAWSSFPRDHARSRAYRWNEDGMAGISDVLGRLCLALALWNGRDPILKERMFGLANGEGNHGEDAKDYWWYLDAVPSSSWLRWRYHYPQRAFPYQDLIETNQHRSRLEPEYELLDTGIFDDDRYWIVEMHYAKADPTDILMRIVVRNRGPQADTLHVLPTVWFRNEWSWEPGVERPTLAASKDTGVIRADHPDLGTYELSVGAAPDGDRPELLFCENETNVARLYGEAPQTPYPKDGINDHVISGAATINPEGTGTKAAAWYQVTVGPGESVELTLRLRQIRDARGAPTRADGGEPFGPGFAAAMRDREREADEFYADLARPGSTPDENRIMRQAFAGMLWGKQYYGYDVARWLDGDPGQPVPPSAHRVLRNARWRNVDAADILSMPDPWEYPWFAAWDLAFHAITLAHVDPAFAKYQLIALCREWFQHPDGALPAYEWSFDDVNPPVHALAALAVWDIDGRHDRPFLERVFHKLLMNFTWWLDREDAQGNDLFSGGFLGLDNIGAFDRSHLPAGTALEQSDATAWMFLYCLSMLTIAVELARDDAAYEDLATTFLEHGVRIAAAMNRSGLWDETDGFYYDSMRLADGRAIPIKVHSMVGLIPLMPTAIIPTSIVERGRKLRKRLAHFLARLDVTEATLREGGFMTGTGGRETVQLSVVPPVRLRKLLAEMLAEDAFLSPFGLRALSKRHCEAPFRLDLDGVTAAVTYEPGDSQSGLFGGNSNWRGPVWYPLNYLVIESLLRWDDWLGVDFVVEHPTGSGRELRLRDVAVDLVRRLVSIWLPDAEGRRAVFGAAAKFQTDPEWRDLLLFYEYFHGDSGAGLGASHQTGWTGLVAHLLCRGGTLDRVAGGQSGGDGLLAAEVLRGQ